MGNNFDGRERSRVSVITVKFLGFADIIFTDLASGDIKCTLFVVAHL